MTTKCPYCGFQEEVSDEYVGQVGECSSCQRDYVIWANNVDQSRSVSVRCPHCGVRIELNEDPRGREWTCLTCGGKFHVNKKYKTVSVDPFDTLTSIVWRIVKYGGILLALLVVGVIIMVQITDTPEKRRQQEEETERFVCKTLDKYKSHARHGEEIYLGIEMQYRNRYNISVGQALSNKDKHAIFECLTGIDEITSKSAWDGYRCKYCGASLRLTAYEMNEVKHASQQQESRYTKESERQSTKPIVRKNRTWRRPNVVNMDFPVFPKEDITKSFMGCMWGSSIRPEPIHIQNGFFTQLTQGPTALLGDPMSLVILEGNLPFSFDEEDQLEVVQRLLRTIEDSYDVVFKDEVTDYCGYAEDYKRGLVFNVGSCSPEYHDPNGYDITVIVQKKNCLRTFNWTTPKESIYGYVTPRSISKPNPESANVVRRNLNHNDTLSCSSSGNGETDESDLDDFDPKKIPDKMKLTDIPPDSGVNVQEGDIVAEKQNAENAQSERRSYAEKILRPYRFDVSTCVALPASMTKYVRYKDVVDDLWWQLHYSRKAEDWLGMLSLMAGRELTEYPSIRTIESLVAGIRDRKFVMRIVYSHDMQSFSISTESSRFPQYEDQGLFEIEFTLPEMGSIFVLQKGEGGYFLDDLHQKGVNGQEKKAALEKYVKTVKVKPGEKVNLRMEGLKVTHKIPFVKRKALQSKRSDDVGSKCHNCGGKGYVKNVMGCKVCNGSGGINGRCGSCKGKGRTELHIKCSSCNGTGRREK